MSEFIPVPRVVGPNYANPVPVSHEPEAGVDAICKVRARHQALRARQEGSAIEHDVLVAVEPLVKVDALYALRRIAFFHCVGKGSHGFETQAARPIGFVACPSKHFIPFFPRHFAAYVGTVGLALLPVKRTWFAIVPMEGWINFRRFAMLQIHLQRAEHSGRVNKRPLQPGR